MSAVAFEAVDIVFGDKPHTALPLMERGLSRDGVVVVVRPDQYVAAVLPLTSMTTLDLWRYATHLDDQAQATQQVRIRFWKKALYPLACVVMVVSVLRFHKRVE